MLIKIKQLLIMCTLYGGVMDINYKHLTLLGKLFPNIDSTAREIINLQAILQLPKGTEHFLSDLHGEYDAFNHVIKNCSGVIREKIEDIYGNTLSLKEREELATILYYPKEKIEEITNKVGISDEYLRLIIHRIIPILKIVASKYSTSKVSKALPNNFNYIIQEILHEKGSEDNKRSYMNSIISSIVEIGQGVKFIVSLSEVISRLTIDTLHIVGDIYDRGPYPDKILDRLSTYHNLDIQWGNHDILWMGAGSGQLGCIANVVRISLRYGNSDTLEDAYGINLLPLATFAMEYYKDDPCTEFQPKLGGAVTEKNISLISKMHKAISIIQFKIEKEIIDRNRDYNMESRNLLHCIDFSSNTITIGNNSYSLLDSNFPTVDRNDPYLLNSDEIEVIERLQSSFLNSDKLKKHVDLLYQKGSIYLGYNGNLLYHGCIPMSKDGSFLEVTLNSKKLSGKSLLDYLDSTARIGRDLSNTAENDLLWYLWCGPLSPLFGKDSMKTFERYFISEKETHKETKNSYYEHFTNVETIKKILIEFNLDSNRGIIINGHVPVKVKKGESPVKGEGKLIIIDGGFSSAYRKETGIAGYTLISNSKSLRIVSHEPFQGVENSVKNCCDIFSTTEVLHLEKKRLLISDTDIGKNLKEQISDLKALLDLYKKGILKEKM